MFKIGDVVSLKSGGCHMTIQNIIKQMPIEDEAWNEVHCVWHGDSFCLHSAGFDERLLKVEEGE